MKNKRNYKKRYEKYKDGYERNLMNFHSSNLIIGLILAAIYIILHWIGII